MATYYGVVRGDVVVLAPGARPPEGSMVEVRVPDEAALLAAKQAMLAAGLIAAIVMPGAPLPPHQPVTPIRLEGRPLSEELLEGRR